MKSQNVILVIAAFAIFTSSGFAAIEIDALIDFDDLSLQTDSYWNGNDGSGGFTSGGGTMNNSYSSGPGWESWDGFGYSNRTDTDQHGISYAQYVSAAGYAQSGTNYAIGYYSDYSGTSPTVKLSTEMTLEGLFITNVNHTKNVIENGDPVFDISPLEPGEWYMVTITGKDYSGTATGSIDVYLADFRNGAEFVATDWMYVDLSGLGNIKSLEFKATGNDIGDYGLDTPAYFAIDTIIPEPATFVLLVLGGLFIKRNSKYQQG